MSKKPIYNKILSAEAEMKSAFIPMKPKPGLEKKGFQIRWASLIVFFKTQTDKVLMIEFRVHVYKGEPRVIIPAMGLKDQKSSWSREQFKEYAGRVFGPHGCSRLMKIVEDQLIYDKYENSYILKKKVKK